MCDHPLVDVWDDGRAPVAEEITREEGEETVAMDPLKRYMQCSDPKCGLEIE